MLLVHRTETHLSGTTHSHLVSSEKVISVASNPSEQIHDHNKESPHLLRVDNPLDERGADVGGRPHRAGRYARDEKGSGQTGGGQGEDAARDGEAAADDAGAVAHRLGNATPANT